MAVEALTAELTAVRGASRKAPLCSFQKANICPRERWLQSLRFLANFGARRFPKGNEGKRVSSGYNRRRRLATRSSGKQQAERTAVRAASIVCPEESPLPASWATTLSQASPPVGNDAPTPARIGTGRPKGRSHFSFGGERKVCKRKPAARRLREKALYCPFWRRGSLCRAQRSWPAYACYRARSELAFFRRQNGRAFFPPLPIAALLRRSLGGDEGQIARVGMLPRCPADFAVQKADRVSKSRWPLVRAGGPVARRRSVQANRRGIISDVRTVAPVVPWR